jgi:hypothetical protein
MQLEVFVLADAATDSQGKLNILGAFDKLFVQSVPVVHPSCAVAIRMRFYSTESTDHEVQLNILDDKGHPVVPQMNGKLNIAFPPDGSSVAVNMVLNIQGLNFHRVGQHTLRLDLDAKKIASIPLYVQKLQDASGARH